MSFAGGGDGGCDRGSGMGFFEGLLGGIVGAELTSLVAGAIERQGGLPVLAAKFEQQGLGHLVRSRVGPGSNLPVTAEQIHQVLGSATVQQMAAKYGISSQQFAEKLAEILPQAVSQMAAAAPKS
jgi:uncharacterized protein YidB (DUF937 family)